MATTPKNLNEFYASRGGLPSISKRAKIYASFGLGNASTYTGTATQNKALLNKLVQTTSQTAAQDSSSARTIPGSSPTPTATIPADTYTTKRGPSGGVIYVKTHPDGTYDESASPFRENAANTQSAPAGVGSSFPPQNDSTQSGNNDQFITMVKKMIEGMYNAGQALNPNVAITPQSAADFLSHLQQNTSSFLPAADAQIAPYYQTQLNTALDSFKTNMNLVPAQYARDIQGIGETFANQGMAQSGRRLDMEQRTTQQYQTAANQTAGQFAQTYGKANLPQTPTLTSPTLTGDRQLPLYTLSPDVYSNLKGTQQFQQQADTASRAAQMESAYRTYNAPQTRQLTF